MQLHLQAHGQAVLENPIRERARRQDRLQRAEATFDPLPVDANVARAFGRIYAAVTAAGRKGRGRRAFDLVIAATAGLAIAQSGGGSSGGGSAGGASSGAGASSGSMGTGSTPSGTAPSSNNGRTGIDTRSTQGSGLSHPCGSASSGGGSTTGLSSRSTAGTLSSNNNPTAGFDAAFGLSAYTPAQQAAARASIQLWDDLIPQSFKETNGMGADIVFANSLDPAQAYAYFPGHRGWKFQSDVFTNDPNNAEAGNWTNNWFSNLGYGNTTLVHELGHALGLASD